MSSSDSLFLTLPLRLQRIIDEAFDLNTDPNSTEYKKIKAKPPNDQNHGVGAGGFLVENTNEPIEDDILDRQNNPWHMPLSSIPSALQLLDLPPDDLEVLSVFKNAASGWTSGSMTSLGEPDPQDKYVSREDWRSVCAVLLENRTSQISDDERLPRVSKSEKRQDVELDSEGYVESESGFDSGESSSDEYMEHHISRPKRMQNQNRQSTSRPAHLPLHLNLEHLSSRQKETCFKTFALFFPEVPHHKLADHRIMIRDLQRVSKLLGEKIKAEEVNFILFLRIIFYCPF